MAGSIVLLVIFCLSLCCSVAATTYAENGEGVAPNLEQLHRQEEEEDKHKHWEREEAAAAELQRVRMQLSALKRSLEEKEHQLIEEEKILLSLKKGLKAAELEEVLKGIGKEISSLKEQIQLLETSAEPHVQDHRKLERLYTTQKEYLKEVELQLQVTQDMMISAQQLVHVKERELNEVYSRWLPSWAAEWVAQSQLLSVGNFFRHLRLHVVKQMLSTALKRQWNRSITSINSYIKMLRSMTISYYKVVKVYISRQYADAIKIAGKNIQVVRKICQPYTDEIIVFIQPSLTWTRELLEPYTKKVMEYYHKVLKPATKLHLKLQREVRKILKKNAYLASVASKEVVWFLASALLALPLYAFLLLASSFFGNEKKQRRPAKGARKARRSKPIER